MNLPVVVEHISSSLPSSQSRFPSHVITVVVFIHCPLVHVKYLQTEIKEDFKMPINMIQLNVC